jgi:hypothetical protein
MEWVELNFCKSISAGAFLQIVEEYVEMLYQKFFTNLIMNLGETTMRFTKISFAFFVSP